MDLMRMPLRDVVGACRDETAKFRRGEPADDGFCFELLRRAICERDGAAWEAVLAQYRGVVLTWARQHPAAAASGEGDDYWVNRAFQRFWMAVGPDRFGNFGGLPALLKYLKLCVHSVLLDAVRAQRATPRDSLDALPAEAAAVEGSGVPDVEALAARRMAGDDLWRAIGRELSDAAEQLVVYLSFARDLKPREIYDRHPDRFAGVADVYRIKRNVLERLRRSPEIRRFLA